MKTKLAWIDTAPVAIKSIQTTAEAHVLQQHFSLLDSKYTYTDGDVDLLLSDYIKQHGGYYCDPALRPTCSYRLSSVVADKGKSIHLAVLPAVGSVNLSASHQLGALPVAYFINKYAQPDEPLLAMLKSLTQHGDLNEICDACFLSQPKFMEVLQDNLSKDKTTVHDREVVQIKQDQLKSFFINSRCDLDTIRQNIRRIEQCKRDVFDEFKTDLINNQQFTIRILAPFLRRGPHWVTLEIEVIRNEYSVQTIFHCHDPYGGGQIDSADSLNLCNALSARLTALFYDSHLDLELKFSNIQDGKVINLTSPYANPRQDKRDQTSCGAVILQDIVKRLDNLPPDHDLSSPYAKGAPTLRRTHYERWVQLRSDPSDSNSPPPDRQSSTSTDLVVSQRFQVNIVRYNKEIFELASQAIATNRRHLFESLLIDTQRCTNHESLALLPIRMSLLALVREYASVDDFTTLYDFYHLHVNEIRDVVSQFQQRQRRDSRYGEFKQALRVACKEACYRWIYHHLGSMILEPKAEMITLRYHDKSGEAKQIKLLPEQVRFTRLVLAQHLYQFDVANLLLSYHHRRCSNAVLDRVFQFTLARYPDLTDDHIERLNKLLRRNKLIDKDKQINTDKTSLFSGVAEQYQDSASLMPYEIKQPAIIAKLEQLKDWSVQLISRITFAHISDKLVLTDHFLDTVDNYLEGFRVSLNTLAKQNDVNVASESNHLSLTEMACPQLTQPAASKDNPSSARQTIALDESTFIYRLPLAHNDKRLPELYRRGQGYQDYLNMLRYARLGVHSQDEYGNTLLHFAIMHGRLLFAKYLVDNGAKLNAINSKGETPLDMIASRQMRRYARDYLRLKDISHQQMRDKQCQHPKVLALRQRALTLSPYRQRFGDILTWYSGELNSGWNRFLEFFTTIFFIFSVRGDRQQRLAQLERAYHTILHDLHDEYLDKAVSSIVPSLDDLRADFPTGLGGRSRLRERISQFRLTAQNSHAYMLTRVNEKLYLASCQKTLLENQNRGLFKRIDFLQNNLAELKDYGILGGELGKAQETTQVIDKQTADKAAQFDKLKQHYDEMVVHNQQLSERLAKLESMVSRLLAKDAPAAANDAYNTGMSAPDTSADSGGSAKPNDKVA